MESTSDAWLKNSSFNAALLLQQSRTSPAYNARKPSAFLREIDVTVVNEMGDLDPVGEIWHCCQDLNFNTYITFRPKEKC